MNQINRPFSYKLVSQTDFAHVIKISGELRRGEQLRGAEWKVFLSQAKDAALKQKKKIIFDLTDLTFWDTEGMGDIVTTVVGINLDSVGGFKQAAIIEPKIEHLLKLAKITEFASRKLNRPIKSEEMPILKDTDASKKFIEG